MLEKTALPRMSIRLALATVLSLALSLSVGVGKAATPASGSVGPTSGSTTSWDFAPVVAGTLVDTGTEDICPLGVCDNYDLTVNLPSDPTTFYVSNSATLTIDYTWTSTLPTDLDIFAFSPNGAKHGPGSPDDTSTGPGEEVLSIFDPLPGIWHIRSVASLTPMPTAAHAVATFTIMRGQPAPTPKPKPGDPSFTNYAAPPPIGQRSGEPSLGADWKTHNVMYTGAACIECNPFTVRVTFNDSTSPATATWTDVTPVGNGSVTLDPIGYLDHYLNRWFMTELAGPCSLTQYTDDDGANWRPSEGCPFPAGVDHESVGGGPYAPPSPITATSQEAIYYCSQDIATAFCGRSDDGGRTFGPPVSLYTLTQCGGLHGHVRGSPDGTVYVPNKGCFDAAGVDRPTAVVSSDNGQTWTVHPVPLAKTKSPGSDPSVAADPTNTIYFGFQNYDGHAKIAISHDHGQTWSKPVDVGTPFGIQNSQFPEVITGDAGQAAFAFLGTTTPGDDQSADFPGVWHMYVAFTHDGGQHWRTVDATPNDPVQRGCIWNGGGSNTCRNMLDFNDITLDNAGRILIAYTDGCTGDCETNPNAANAPSGGTGRYSRIASILRQSGGNLFFTTPR